MPAGSSTASSTASRSCNCCGMGGVGKIKRIKRAFGSLLYLEFSIIMSQIRNSLLWIILIIIDPFMYYVPTLNNGEKKLDINKPLMITLIVLYWPLMVYRVYTAMSLSKDQRLIIISTKLTLLFCNHIMGLYVINFNPTINVPSPYSVFLIFTVFIAFLVRITAFKKFCVDGVIGTPHHRYKVILKRVIVILLFLFGGHLFGGMWYFLAVLKEMRCWKQACQLQIGCRFARDHFFTGYKDDQFLHHFCFENLEQVPGLFKKAFESRIVENKIL